MIHLSNIPFKWASTSPNAGLDCFTFASHVSATLTGEPFDLSLPPIARAYENHKSEQEAPGTLVYDVAKELGLKQVIVPLKGTLLIIRAQTLCLATCLGHGGIAFMGLNGSVVDKLSRFEGSNIWAAYEPEGLWVKESCNVQRYIAPLQGRSDADKCKNENWEGEEPWKALRESFYCSCEKV